MYKKLSTLLIFISLAIYKVTEFNEHLLCLHLHNVCALIRKQVFVMQKQNFPLKDYSTKTKQKIRYLHRKLIYSLSRHNFRLVTKHPKLRSNHKNMHLFYNNCTKSRNESITTSITSDSPKPYFTKRKRLSPTLIPTLSSGGILSYTIISADPVYFMSISIQNFKQQCNRMRKVNNNIDSFLIIGNGTQKVNGSSKNCSLFDNLFA